MSDPKRARSRCAAACASLASLLPLAAPAADLGPHVHGSAALRISVDGTLLEATLESPLTNLIGFERSPRNDKERATVRAMAQQLRQPQTLFPPTAAARCTPSGVEIEAPTLPAELLGNATQPAPAAGTVGSSGHADLDASFRWRCEAPAQLKGMDVGLLAAFPGLHTLKVQLVGPRGQSATVLSSGGARSLSW